MNKYKVTLEVIMTTNSQIPSGSWEGNSAKAFDATFDMLINSDHLSTEEDIKQFKVNVETLTTEEV